MGYRNREIEKKYTVEAGSYNETVEALEGIFDYDRKIVDASKDYYWHAPTGMKADFGRLRFMPKGGGQMTIKYADRESNLNRVEIDVEVDDTNQAKKFMTQIMGEPCGSIYKKYHVLFLGDEHTTVSVYSVRGDPKKRVFVEVEATSESKLAALEKKIIDEGKVTIKHEPRALYQIFFKEEK
jgi:adenylate cyclase class IV